LTQVSRLLSICFASFAEGARAGVGAQKHARLPLNLGEGLDFFVANAIDEIMVCP
jgi:hypothetical protein